MDSFRLQCRGLLVLLPLIAFCCAGSWAQKVQVITTPAADLGASIANACAAAGANGQIKVNVPGGTISSPAFDGCAASTVIQFGPGQFTFTGAGATNTIAANGIKVLGAGRGATIFQIDSASSTLFTINAQYFELAGMHIRPAPGVTRSGGNLVIANGAMGMVHDVFLVDLFNGFLLQGPNTGGWTFENISIFSAGGTWNYLFKTYSPTATTSSFTIHNVGGDLAGGTQAGPLFVFDSRTDTVTLSDINIVGAGGQPIVRCQDTDNAGVGQWPRWIHFTNSFFEAPNATAIDIRNGRDFSYQNSYVSGANVGIVVGPGAFDTKIIGNVFPNLARQAITIAAGSKATIIQGNTFDGTGMGGNALYPIVDVASGAADFNINGNQSTSFYPNTNWPNYGVRIASKSTRFFVNNNNFQQTKLGAVRNSAGAGSVYNVSANMP
jgi:hypothetical protein